MNYCVMPVQMDTLLLFQSFAVWFRLPKVVTGFQVILPVYTDKLTLSLE